MSVRWSSSARSVLNETCWLRWMHRGTWGVKTLCKHASRPHGQPCFDEFGHHGECLSNCLKSILQKGLLLGQVGFLKNAEVLFDFMRCCSPDMNVAHDNCQCFGSEAARRWIFPDPSRLRRKSTQGIWWSWCVTLAWLKLQDTSVGEKLESLELCQHQAFLRNDFRMLDVGGLVIKYELLPEGSFKKGGCVNAPSHPEEPPKMRGYFGLQAKINHTWRDCWTSSKMVSLPSAFSVHAVSAPANWNRGCLDRRPVSSRDDPWRVSHSDASEVT